MRLFTVTLVGCYGRFGSNCSTSVAVQFGASPLERVLGLTTGSTKDLTRLIIRAFLGDADGGMGRPRAEA